MRSELIFGAITHVSNRYLLIKLAAKATRKFHRPNTRIQDTTNDVLMYFSRSSPISTV
nr:DNA-directed RNA polymerase subunit omega [Edaphobacter aggregans]